MSSPVQKENNLPTPDLDQLCINTIRALSLDAVQKANSGHPGLPLGAAPMAYVLWTRLLKHNPRNPHWFDRDRFVLSAGHGSMLLYALLHLTGYALPLEEIRRFRQLHSKTPGHPARAERGRPSLILVRTHTGYGSPHKHDTFEAHGSPLGEDEVRLTKQNLGWPTEPAFLIPAAALEHFREADARGVRDETAWNERL